MRFSKPFRIFAWSLLATFLLVVVTSSFLSIFYEKAIVRYMQRYLDEHLLTELSMKDIRFRVLKGFPNATVEISNPVLLSGEEFNVRDFRGTFADTLLQAKSVSFQFDLLKLLGKKYELKKIEISQGRLNILLDKNKQHNLKIWKTSEKQTGESYTVNLKSIELNSTEIRVISLREQLNLAAYSRRSTFKGTYSGHILSGETRGTLSLDSLTVKGNRLIRNASLHLVLKMAYGGNRFRISQGRVHLNKAVANISGEYKYGRENTIDLTLDMPKFGLEELMSLFPSAVSAIPASLSFTGNGKLSAVVKGSLTHTSNLMIRSAFELENCTARNTDNNIQVSHINLKGSVTGTRAENFELQVDEFTSDLGKGTVGGNFTLRNLNTLLFRAEIHSILDLEAVDDFAGLDTIENMQGLINSDFILSGSLKHGLDSAASPLQFLEKGTFVFDKVALKLKNNPLDIQKVTGKASWDDVLVLDSLKFYVNETNFLVNGSVEQLKGYLLKQAQLKSNLEIITDNFNINKLFISIPKKKSNGTGKSLAVFPSNMQMKAHIKAENFTAGKFTASDVALHLSAIRDSIYIHDFNLKFPDGSITGNALITANANKILTITCNSTPYKINIQQLFTAFNNFTQHFIVDKNIRGLLSGSVSFVAQWDSTLRFMPGNLKAQADFTIANGELIQFEPMLRLSKYIDVEELRHIRFKTLKNVIFITDRMVTMPEMAIHSTAFNISVAGQHSFSNEFDYRMRVLLSEVLLNKARKKKKEIDEFMVEENTAEKATIPLIIAGTPNDFDVRLDRKRAFDLTRKSMVEEIVAPENKPAPNNFKIEWEEEKKEVETGKPTINSNDSDFVIEWEDNADNE